MASNYATVTSALVLVVLVLLATCLARPTSSVNGTYLDVGNLSYIDVIDCVYID